MQSKKRAKPVKFGPKSKPEPKAASVPPKEDAEPVVEKEQPEDIKNEKDIETPVEVSSDEVPSVEAIISSTTEIIEIKEVTKEPEKENPDKVKEKEEVVQDPPDEEKEADVAAADKSEEDDAPSDNEEESGSSEVDGAPIDESVDDSPVNKDGAFFNAPPDEYDKKKSMLPYFLRVMVITFILGMVFFAGIYYAVTNKSKLFPATNKSTVEVTEAPAAIAPTKKPVDLSLYTIQVLNGTNTSGVAAKVRDQLTTEGFKVGSVGNAKTDDFEKTEIAVAEKVEKEYLDKLKEILSKTYVLGEVTALASGSSDVVITIGSSSAK
ncbi:MAG TPA: LytR C-terminal domain-containing protein [Xanthomonadales bacterium]|nr:LytR C-terminal domain-containing protein [Xanthomonadales bacterium]